MKQFATRKLILALLLNCMAGLWVSSFFQSLHAEGTKELMPFGPSSSCKSYINGNDGAGKEGPRYGRPKWDLIHIHIQDPSKEVIYYGFTRLEPTGNNAGNQLYYQILDPDSIVVVTGRVARASSDSGFIANDAVAPYIGPIQIAGLSSGGYHALRYKPLKAGDYFIQFNVGHISNIVNTSKRFFVHPFDVTVADESDPLSPTPLPGRLFSFRWHLNTASATNKACMHFYTWTPDSMVIRMDMNEIQPYGYTVSFNSHGVTKTGNLAQDRKSSATITNTIPEYRVFLNEPDIHAYPTGTPGKVNYVEINTCSDNSSFCIMVHTTKAGEINVYIDLDGNGAYDPGGIDVYFPHELSRAGESCIPWDGLNGLGNPVTGTVLGNVMVEYLAGIVHFPVYDPENHPKGFSCALIRPTGLTPLMYWDNSATAIGTKNLSGCSSGCNTWTGNKGDNVMVNTWLNNLTSADTAELVVNPFCTPVARNDTACTLPGIPIEVMILANDTDADNALDFNSVMIDNIHPEMSLLFFDPTTGGVFFIPEPELTYSVTFDYTLCDVTGEEFGGPLCAGASVLIDIFPGCPDMVVLSGIDFRLTGASVPAGVQLQWNDPERKSTGKFLIERKKGQEFATIGMVEANGDKFALFLDDQPPLGQELATYRVKKWTPEGNILVSETVSVSVKVNENRTATFFYNEAGGFAEVNYRSLSPCVLKVFTPHGAQVWKERLESAPDGKVARIPSDQWAKGLYLIRFENEEALFTWRLLVR